MTSDLPPWITTRNRTAEAAQTNWANRLDDAARTTLQNLPIGWGEALENYQTAQQLLTDAGVPTHDPRWVYSDHLDSRIAQHITPALARLARIAAAHRKNVDEHGGTYGECTECGWKHPCPTYIWATSDRDPLATWNPHDDETAPQ